MENWQRTLWIVFIAQLVSAVGFSVMFPFLPLYVAELGTHTSLSLEFWAAMVFSGQALTMMISSPFWGSVADRHGHVIMLKRATYGGTIIILLMGFARSAEELALLRAIQGFITGTIAAANALVASTAPRERTGYAMGMLQMGLWIGVASGPLVGGLIADMVGYRAAFVVTSAMLLISGMIVTFGLRHVPKPQQSKQAARGMAGWHAIMSAPGVALVFLVRFCNWLSQTMLLPILPLFIQSLLGSSKGSNSFIGLVQATASAAGTLSAVYFGKLGDRIGHRPVLIGSVLTAALFSFPQALVTAGWQLLVLQALFGIAAGGMAPSLSALLSRFTQPGTEGAVYGLDNSIAAGARTIAPLIGAVLATILGPRSLFIIAGSLLLIATWVSIRWMPRSDTVGESIIVTDEKSSVARNNK